MVVYGLVISQFWDRYALALSYFSECNVSPRELFRTRVDLTLSIVFTQPPNLTSVRRAGRKNYESLTHLGLPDRHLLLLSPTGGS